MAEISHETTSIEAGVGVSGGKAGIPLPPGGARRLPTGSESTAAEVALPDLRKLLEDLSAHSNIGLTYVIDRETHSVTIKVIDRDTDEVLREVPSEEMRKLGAAMRDLFGLLFKAEV